MKKGNWNKGLSIVTSIVLLIGILPVTGAAETVYAEENERTEKTISLGTDALSDPVMPEDDASAWNGDYVYYGVYHGEPMRYRVLDAGTTAFGDGETLLLDSDRIVEKYHFHDSDTVNVWADSDLRRYLNSEGAYRQSGFLSESFSAQEQAAIALSLKQKAGDDDGAGWEDVLDFAPLGGEKIFVLDAAELTNAAYGYGSEKGTFAARAKQDMEGSAQEWWMRSAVGGLTKVAGFVSKDGDVERLRSVTNQVGISPAMNVRKEEILFVNSDKAAKTAQALTAPKEADKDAAWTLTLKDDALSVEADEDIIRFVTADETKYLISYRAGAVSAERAARLTQLSMMITDIEYDAAGAQILYYGKMADIAVASDETESAGTVEVVLPKLDGEYHCYLVAEEIGGEHMTDYASVSEEIDFTAAKTAITHVSVRDITPAEGGHKLDTLAVCETEGVLVKQPAVSWTPADEERAKFDTAYTAKLTLEAEEGYIFYQQVTAEIDGTPAALVTPHETGTTRTVYSQEYHTAKAKLLEIAAMQNISVENGTPLSQILERLPKTVAIVTEDEEIDTAELVWNTAELAQQYNPSLMSDQSFTVPGRVVCPQAIDTNQQGLDVHIIVEILSAKKVYAPRADLQPGTYQDAQIVSLSCETDGAAIYYTTDGSAPSAANGTLYAGPIVVNGAKGSEQVTTIRAVAVLQGLLDSDVAAFTYTIKIPTTVSIQLSNNLENYVTCDEEAPLMQQVPGGDDMEEIVFEAKEGFCIPQGCQVYVNGMAFNLVKQEEDGELEEESAYKCDDDDGDDDEDDNDYDDDGDDDEDDSDGDDDEDDDDEDDGDDDGDDDDPGIWESDGEQVTVCGIVIQESDHQMLVISGTPTADVSITLFSIGVHNGGAGVVEEPPTCGVEGEIAYRCNSCGESWSDSIEPTGNHTYVFVNIVPPTYETEGIMAHFECSECGTIFADEHGETELEPEDLIIPKLVPKEPESETPIITGPTIIATEPVVLPTIGEEPELVIGNAFSSKWVTSEAIDDSILPAMMESIDSGATYNTLYWKEVKGADGYLVYGAECGTNQNVVKKIKDIKNSYTTTYKHKKLKRDTWYRYKVVPYRLDNGKRVALGKTLEMFAVTATKSGKYANPTAIKLSSSKISVKKGKSAVVSAKVFMPKNKKSKKYTAEIRWISSNTKVAKVDKKGKITAKKKGNCYVYAFTRNGVSKRVKVTVK